MGRESGRAWDSLTVNEDPKRANEHMEARGGARYVQGVRSVTAQQVSMQCRCLGAEESTDFSACSESSFGRLMHPPPPRCSGALSVTTVHPSRDSEAASITPPSTLDAGGPKHRKAQVLMLADTGKRRTPCAWPWTRELRPGSSACRACVAGP